MPLPAKQLPTPRRPRPGAAAAAAAEPPSPAALMSALARLDEQLSNPRADNSPFEL